MNNLKIRPDLEEKINKASQLLNASGTAVCNYLIEMTVDHLNENLEVMNKNIAEVFGKVLKGKYTLVQLNEKKIKAEIKTRGKKC